MQRFDSTTEMTAAAYAAAGTGHPVADAVQEGLARIEQVPQDVAQLPLVQQFALVMPAADLLLGGGMLMVIMLVHATGVRFATDQLVAIVGRCQNIKDAADAQRAGRDRRPPRDDPDPPR